MRIGVGRILLAGMALICAIQPVLADSPAANDEVAIRAIIRRTWETPERPIQIEPVVIVGSHAIAGWVQGALGGRALLRRENGIWSVAMCGGDGLRDAANIASAGVPLHEATRLAQELAGEEAKLTPGHRTLFSRFDGIRPVAKGTEADHHQHHHQGN